MYPRRRVSPKRKVRIYGLCWPESNIVFYVGQTARLRWRHRKHWERFGPCGMFLLDKVPRDDADAAEAWWIHAYLWAGAPLVNRSIPEPPVTYPGEPQEF